MISIGFSLSFDSSPSEPTPAEPGIGGGALTVSGDRGT
jgi:hypothetical protein